MCGIVGAISRHDVIPMLMEGLRRLEYRGYDSCGVAVLKDGAPYRIRSVGRVSNLWEQVSAAGLSATMGIAHTRWATHGTPVAENAHPIFSRGEIALVHNGIIENHETLRDELKDLGYVFESDTDTEVIAHLIHHVSQEVPDGDLLSAVRLAWPRLHGAYAIAVFAKSNPERVIAARVGSPLVIGIGEDGNYLASDFVALSDVVQQFIFLAEGDVVALSADAIQVVDRHGEFVRRGAELQHANHQTADLGTYRHYMQKEIFEQPTVIADAAERIQFLSPRLFGDGAEEVFADVDSILLLACGTSYYSALTAKYWIESMAGILTQVEVASEYRYRDSVTNPRTLVIAVSQSGETADTLAALRHARQVGHHHSLAICNVSYSSIIRESELHYLTCAGPEIGVASTKAFTTQLVALFLLSLTLAKQRGRLDSDREKSLLRQVQRLPLLLNEVLALEGQLVDWARIFARQEHALFLGRGAHYPIALEGALKLKEISYVHAEAYPAGELKHGPLAIVTSDMPVVTLVPDNAVLEKLKSNIQEVRARGGQIFAIADQGTGVVDADGVRTIQMPAYIGPLSPLLYVVPLQLLAYHTTCLRGTDVDKPRNLAKSVTVE
ncbi:glutamine--fructose-6-phosphate transaminase (isomerizing) [Burkholderia ubonensis]|uniref:glutamine--fructose-6-phosphate transaminase (isomerizing) n=1 Tax=Burkholderia ubonensis TaxID=101571 RepID=UPI0007575E52|nr:glutamine--fructose-6-phosphate transaminase (isomerizing) [Burkholderia ubonensis]KVN50069.1 glutamine--fructose-6-phosphate aminotransferase [Burkholderia ubonensis]